MSNLFLFLLAVCYHVPKSHILSLFCKMLMYNCQMRLYRYAILDQLFVGIIPDSICQLMCLFYIDLYISEGSGCYFSEALFSYSLIMMGFALLSSPHTIASYLPIVIIYIIYKKEILVISFPFPILVLAKFIKCIQVVDGFFLPPHHHQNSLIMMGFARVLTSKHSSMLFTCDYSILHIFITKTC